MTLLITILAAVAATIVWYFVPKRATLLLGTLSLMYWGAALMWFVDAIFEYRELGADYFTPASTDMLNDSYLGLSVVALGLVIWLAMLLWRDPQGVVRSTLLKKA